MPIPLSVLDTSAGSVTGESRDKSLIVELWQLISQDYSMVHTSGCDGDQVDDTPARAISVHGQSDGCRGFALERGAENGLALIPFHLLSNHMPPLPQNSSYRDFFRNVQ